MWPSPPGVPYFAKGAAGSAGLAGVSGMAGCSAAGADAAGASRIEPESRPALPMIASVMLVTMKELQFKGWKLFLGTWWAFWGLLYVLNDIEIYWYNESFPMFTYDDVTRIIISAFLTFDVMALVGMWLVNGFKGAELAPGVIFSAGRYGWKVALFCVAYSLIYYLFGFIPWMLPEVRDFYASWAITSEPLYVLLLFNVFRGALWLLFSLPLLMGLKSRRQGFWLLPLVLVTGTAVAVIVPSAVMPGTVRLGHFIELFTSMTLVGLFMVMLFVKDRVHTS